MTPIDEAGPQEPGAPTARRRKWLPLVVLLILAFALGLVAAGWALVQSPMLRLKVLGAPQVVTRQVLLPQPARPIAPALGAVEERLGTLEEKVDAVDEQSRAVIGNVDRAEGLLLAFAARRALDRGLELGYLEGLLRERFGDRDPQAVATIITAARNPVTIDELRVGLNEVPAADLVANADEGWWAAFRRDLGGIVAIRRADVPSAATTDRLSRARALLDDGQVDRALAEVARLPGRDNAAAWMAQARRYVVARGALDRIEMASLMAPHA